LIVPLRLPAEADRIVELLEAIQVELVAIRERLPEPPRADERLARLLAAIHAVLGEGEFTVPWLFDASADVILPGAEALAAALLAVVGRGRPQGAHRRLGRFLASHAGAASGGFRLVRLSGRHRDGALYRVTRVTEAR
jgi:hypothetical protein